MLGKGEENSLIGGLYFIDIEKFNFIYVLRIVYVFLLFGNGDLDVFIVFNGYKVVIFILIL